MAINKVETNIPLLDNVVYYSKYLTFNSIIKDMNQATNNETLESIKSSDKYIACIENVADFQMFEYTIEQLKKVGLTDDKYLANKHLIPTDKRKELIKIAASDFVNNYEELNNYYRMLMGLPDVGDKGIYIDYIDDIPPKYIHEMNEDELLLLDELGELTQLKAAYPTKKYLNFLGMKKIDPYFARRTPNFGLLYYPDIDIPEVTGRFLEIYEKNRVYTLTAVYNPAFKIGSDYYDNFIMLFIKIQTIVDMISNIPDYIIKKDLFDIKSIKYMFESNGIQFFEEIPLKYQVAMLKNMNNLVKFKSTTKNMIDICSIFGFDNIEIFKYYLLKERNVDKAGNYLFETKEIENDKGLPEIVEDNEKNYNLKFIKVPIEDDLDKYIRDENNYVSYEEMIDNDPYWNGDRTAEEVKKEILDYEFNYLRSKYISIDTIYKMDELCFELSYFFNMIFDNVDLENNLRLMIKPISTDRSLKLNHVIYYLYTLMYEQAGIKDTIFDTTTKVMHVKGFNFEADLLELSNYINSKGFTMEELGIDFEIPNKSFLTINQLIELFLKNRKCYNHVVQQMISAKNKRIYDIYKHIYDALMITEINDKIFQLKDGTIAPTYTDYFKEKDLLIYNHFMNIRKYEGDEKQNKISEIMTAIVYALEDYVDTTEFKFLFTNLPSVSSELVKGYIFKVINFFKSYKIELSNINTIYKFDDKIENKIFVLDDINYSASFTAKDLQKYKEKTYFNILMTLNSKVSLKDYVMFAYIFKLYDSVDIEDLIKLTLLLKENDYSHFQFKTFINKLVDLTKKDKVNIEDNIFISKNI